MKNSRTAIMSAFLVIAAAASASAQTATQALTIDVQAINKITVAGGAHTLTINTATAGDAPDAQTWTTSWAITTNQSNMKVTASIATPMPANTSLAVDLGAPAGGSSSVGVVTLDDTEKDLVTGITKLNASSMPLAYTATAGAAAGVQTISKTVTFTITTGA